MEIRFGHQIFIYFVILTKRQKNILAKKGKKGKMNKYPKERRKKRTSRKKYRKRKKRQTKTKIKFLYYSHISEADKGRAQILLTVRFQKLVTFFRNNIRLRTFHRTNTSHGTKDRLCVGSHFILKIHVKNVTNIWKHTL